MKNFKSRKYIFQRRKIGFCRKIFQQGLNASGYILLSLIDGAQTFSFLLAESFSRDSRFWLLTQLLGGDHKKSFKRKTIQVNLSRLKREGLIREESKKKFCLTEKGKEMIIYIKERHSVLEKSWDKKIRIVIFDIPEKEAYLRKWFREELILLQYKELQKSVYIGKYPLPKTLYQEIIKYKLYNNVHIFSIDQADKQPQLLKILKD